MGSSYPRSIPDYPTFTQSAPSNLYFCPFPIPNPRPLALWQDGHMFAHGPYWVAPSINVLPMGFWHRSHLAGGEPNHFFLGTGGFLWRRMSSTVNVLPFTGVGILILFLCSMQILGHLKIADYQLRDISTKCHCVSKCLGNRPVIVPNVVFHVPS